MRPLRRVARSLRRPSQELARELQEDPAWVYPWSVGRAPGPPLLHPNLPQVHETRREMIEQPVRRCLAAAGQDARALDLACSEGWFSHLLLEWGASRVVGVDIRPRSVRRAELIRDHYGISPERLSFRRADVFDLDLADLGQFDVVLLLGLIYHLENPAGAVRRARALTQALCVIESQLTRQAAPIEHTWGAQDVLEAEGSLAVLVEDDHETNPLASSGGIISLVPNRTALEQLTRAAGFRRVEFLEARGHHDPQYVRGDRGVVAATP